MNRQPTQRHFAKDHGKASRRSTSQRGAKGAWRSDAGTVALPAPVSHALPAAPARAHRSAPDHGQPDLVSRLTQSRTGRVMLHAGVCIWLGLHGVNHVGFHVQGILREIKGM